MPSARRPADRRHLQRRRAPSAPRVASLCSLCRSDGLPHRLEHVEIVVARRAVGAEPDRDAGAKYAGTGAVPLASFMLLSGLCETPTPAPRPGAMSALRDPDAVRAEHVRRRGTRGCRGTPTGDGLTRSCAVLASSRVSARWISVGTPCRCARSRAAMSVGPSSVYIACGATAGVISGSPLNWLDERRRARERRPRASSRRPPETG